MDWVCTAKRLPTAHNRNYVLNNANIKANFEKQRTTEPTTKLLQSNFANYPHELLTHDPSGQYLAQSAHLHADCVKSSLFWHEFEHGGDTLLDADGQECAQGLVHCFESRSADYCNDVGQTHAQVLRWKLGIRRVIRIDSRCWSDWAIKRSHRRVTCLAEATRLRALLVI